MILNLPSVPVAFWDCITVVTKKLGHQAGMVVFAWGDLGFVVNQK